MSSYKPISLFLGAKSSFLHNKQNFTLGGICRSGGTELVVRHGTRIPSGVPISISHSQTDLALPCPALGFLGKGGAVDGMEDLAREIRDSWPMIRFWGSCSESACDRYSARSLARRHQRELTRNRWRSVDPAVPTPEVLQGPWQRAKPH